MVTRPSRAGIARLRSEVAGALGVGERDLVAALFPLVEAELSDWERRFGASPALDVKVSALLAMEGVPGLARPRVVDRVVHAAAYQRCCHELRTRFPDRMPTLELVLRRLGALVPRLSDLSETRRVLEVAFEGHVPSSLSSLLELLGAPAPLVVGGEPTDPVRAARHVVERADPAFALGLLDQGLVPDPVASWMEERRARRGARAALAPLRAWCGLPAEAQALVVFGAPRRPASWGTSRHHLAHIARLSRVRGWDEQPTLCPSRMVLGRLEVGPVHVAAYEAALADDALERAEELIDADQCSEHEARRRAAVWAMTGFTPFLDYLRAVAALGAPVHALPRPLPVERTAATRYQGMREDLCPEPEVALELLRLAPELLATEPDGRLIVIQMLSAARSSAVLALRRSWVVSCAEGLLLYVPWQVNKTGRGLLFIPDAFVEHYGVHASWLPVEAPRDPSILRREELARAIERLCRRFEERTGTHVAHVDSRFTRNMLAQLYRRHLRGTSREAITALLGHKARTTRVNYLRPWPGELAAARAAWRCGGG